MTEEIIELIYRKPSQQFKVGDKIRIINWIDWKDRTGKVAYIIGDFLRVDLDEGGQLWPGIERVERI